VPFVAVFEHGFHLAAISAVDAAPEEVRTVE
jgi:hypothetical protein